jgi:REP element-mobilizing transposase RayT
VAKRIRLPLDTYAVPGLSWLVTIGVLDRSRQPFRDERLSQSILTCISEDIPKRGGILHLAVTMPDHAHLIVEIADGDLIAIMRDVKTHTTRLWWQHGGQGALWQKSFHDRGLRGPKAFDEAVAYVLENPVRAGLAQTWEEYPHIAGSAVAPEL